MASRQFSSSWLRFFERAQAQQTHSAPPLRQPAPQAPRVPSREELEVAWLLRCLPPTTRASLTPDLLALKRSRPKTGAPPVAAYTWPDVPGVRRPRYLNVVLQTKTLEGLCSWLRAELRLGVKALCAPESELPRPTRNALLAMQGRRLAQVSESLARLLPPEEVLRLLRHFLMEW